MRQRWKPLILWGIVVGLGLFVAGYLLGAMALLIWSFGQTPTATEAFDWWTSVAVHPRTVLGLLLTERAVQGYALGIAGCLGSLVLWGWLDLWGKQPRPAAASQYGSHGTARWARTDEIASQFASDGAGAVLGQIWHQKRWRKVIFPWATRNRNRFLLIIGPPGSGKTSRYSLPNLLHAGQIDKHRSILATDPKGELYAKMSGYLKKQGFEVRAINLLHPQASDRYNPMDYVHSVEDAFRLANTIIANTSGQSATGEAFWVNAERSLLACLIWYVKKTLKPQYQHLATVLNLGMAFSKDAELMKALFSAKDLDPEAKVLYNQVSGLTSKTRDGVYIGFAVRLQLWASSEIAALTAASDFSLRDLGRRPIALFLIIPDHHSTYQALTSLLFDQAFQELIAEADENRGRLTCEVRLMLEEMANIGRIPDLEKRLATIRSRGLLVEMVLQTVGQLKALYGEAWNTIVGCADTVLALSANDMETAEWISKRLGTTTIRTTSTSSTSTDRGDSNSQSHHYTSRALMLPEEIQGQGDQGLPDDVLLLMQRGLPPAKLTKLPIDDLEGADELATLDPRKHKVMARPEDRAPLPDVENLKPKDYEPAWVAAQDPKQQGGVAR